MLSHKKLKALIWLSSERIEFFSVFHLSKAREKFFGRLYDAEVSACLFLINLKKMNFGDFDRLEIVGEVKDVNLSEASYILGTFIKQLNYQISEQQQCSVSSDIIELLKQSEMELTMLTNEPLAELSESFESNNSKNKQKSKRKR